MIDPAPHFELTDSDKVSALWLRLKAHLQDQLDMARRRNDAPTLSEPLTAALRGEIRCLRGLISLGDDRPTLTGE